MLLNEGARWLSSSMEVKARATQARAGEPAQMWHLAAFSRH